MMSFLKVKYILVCIIVACGSVCAQPALLERLSPESQSLSSSDVRSFFDAMADRPGGEAHGVMVLRHGKVVGEMVPKPFSPDYGHTLYSASKTFVGVAVGLAVEENRLRLTDRVAAFFPELLPDSVSDNLAAMTLRDLLTMTSGIEPDWLMRTSCADWLSRLLSMPVGHPGERFRYDSMCSYLLSAIVQRVTGRKLLDYLNERLFFPMGITEAQWEESPEGVNTGGWGLWLRLESMAKFGQLLLDKGRWEGRQLVASDWVEEMTSSLQETDMADTYGFQTWRCDYPDAFRADGALGQYIIVAPKEDMVVAITQANTGNGKAERKLVWNLLSKAQPLPLPEGGAYDELRKAQGSYVLPVVKGKPSAKLLARLAEGEFVFEKNDLDWKTLRLSSSKDTLRMVVTTESGESYAFPAGRGEWLTSSTDVCPPYSIRAVERFRGIRRDFHVAACFGGDRNHLEVKVRYPDWVSGADFSITLADNILILKAKENWRKEFKISGEFRKDISPE